MKKLIGHSNKKEMEEKVIEIWKYLLDRIAGAARRNFCNSETHDGCDDCNLNFEFCLINSPEKRHDLLHAATIKGKCIGYVGDCTPEFCPMCIPILDKFICAYRVVLTVPDSEQCIGLIGGMNKVMSLRWRGY